MTPKEYEDFVDNLVGSYSLYKYQCRPHQICEPAKIAYWDNELKPKEPNDKTARTS